jgi:hypothetical protein
MTEESTRYAIRLDTGQWYQGKDEKGEPRWTRVPSWAYIFKDPAELAEFLEWLEQTDFEYTLLEAK